MKYRYHFDIMISFPLDKYPEMVFQDCIVVVFLIFLEETLIFLEDTGASVHGFLMAQTVKRLPTMQETRV